MSRGDDLQAVAEFSKAFEDDDIDARRKAVEQMKPLWEWKQTEKAVADEIKKIDPHASEYPRMGSLRRWLHDHPGEDLDDLEAGLVAFLQPGGSSTVYDAPAAIKERDAPLYRRLEELGCLAVDAKRIDDAIKRGWLSPGDVAPFRHEVDKTPSLRVVRAEERRK